MASSEQYAAWIVKNKDKKGTKEFDTVVKAYKESKARKEQERPEINKVAEGARKFAQGATFGFSDELEAGLRSAATAQKDFGMTGLAAGLTPTKKEKAGTYLPTFEEKQPLPKKDIFDQMGLRTQEVSEDFVPASVIKKQLDAQSKEFERQNPYLAGGLEIAGGFLTPAMALKGATTAGTIGKNIIGGAATGALGGAGRAESGNRLEGALQGGALGGAFGGALSTIGSAIAPTLQKGARELQKKGVTLTPGQAFGGKLDDVEQAAGNLIGSIGKRRNENLIKFNESVINSALKPLGKKISVVDDVQGAVGKAQQLISNSYDEVLPKLTLKANDKLKKDMKNILTSDRFKNMSPALKKEFNKEVNNIFSRLGVKGKSGQTLKDIQTDINSLVQDFSTQGGSFGTYGRALGEVKDLFNEALKTQNPKFSKKLADINKSYSNLKRVQDASAKINTTKEAFSPNQLLMAARKGDVTKGKSKTAAGEAIMQREAKQAGILGDTVADSGTTMRLLTNLGLLGGGGAIGIPASVLALPAASYLLYSKPGQAIFNKWISQRSRTPQQIADFIKNYSTAGASGLLTQTGE